MLRYSGAVSTYYPSMTAADAENLNLLRSIARQAMQERGLLPDFSAAALQQIEAIAAAAAETGQAIRDLRGLLWASIDNDDSRDLDQLSVAQPSGRGGEDLGGDRRCRCHRPRALADR